MSDMTSSGIKERPILFSDAMVRAILDGRKTQTRRVVKPIVTETLDFLSGANEEDHEPDSVSIRWGQAEDDDGRKSKPQWLVYMHDYPEEGVLPIGVGYGNIGDRLWVRETWAPFFKRTPTSSGCVYRSDIGTYRINPGSLDNQKWKPSIHMPRWASRITLEITNVRAERLQQISEQDAIAEGVCCAPGYPHGSNDQHAGAFKKLWDSINVARDFGWDTNPWVWVVEFKRFPA